MDDYNFNFGDDGSEGEEGEDGERQFGGRNATVFLIDAAPQMFETIKSSDENGEESSFTPFETALKCVHSSVCRQVISSDQDLCAVVLFNTKESVGRSSKVTSSATIATFPHVAVLQQLDRPSADRVIQLENIMKETLKAVTAEFGGTCEGASISDALWACSNLLTQCKSRLSGQNVLLFTCRDSPHTSNTEHLARQALCKARDLDDAGIDLELLFLSHEFSPDNFYKEVLTLGGDAPERAPAMTSSSRLEQLQDRVRRLEHKQRTTGRVVFKLAPGLEMSVGLYTGIRKSNKPSKQKLSKASNEEVRAVTKEYLEETGELLMSSDFCKYQTYGEKKIKFSVAETRDICKVHPPGIELLGFKPSSVIKAFQYVKPASFLYPNDNDIKGSCSVFSALLSRSAARSVVPIVRIVARTNSAPSWAALLPQEEELDEDGCQVHPPGFHVCYLPFADDYRQITVEGRTRATAEQVDHAKAIVKKLHFRYDPSCFENPDLQTHWRNIEALALNRQSLEPVIDYTLPDYGRIRKKIGHLVSELKTSIWPDGYDPVAAASKKPPPKPRQPKSTATAAPPAGDASVEQMAKDNTVAKLTVPVLKEWLTGRECKVAGKKKSELVQDVYDILA
uniref:ATP-dependent DNA helicase 2 subunit 1 n=1 Tax=Hirondellea gigas TaxID=1518452 RepID=A0A2P2HZY3_9CRUS